MTDEDARNIVIGELGNIGEAQISKLIAKARTPDPRRKVQYVSARRLFSGLTAIKENAERRRLSESQTPRGAHACNECWPHGAKLA
jgi:hypothetical protein